MEVDVLSENPKQQDSQLKKIDHSNCVEIGGKESEQLGGEIEKVSHLEMLEM